MHCRRRRNSEHCRSNLSIRELANHSKELPRNDSASRLPLCTYISDPGKSWADVLGVTVTWWSGIILPPGMRSPYPSISIAGSSRYSQCHIAMRKHSASKCSDRYLALATHFVVSAPNLDFCDVSVTIVCVPSEQSFSNRHLLRLPHGLKSFRVIRRWFDEDRTV